MVNIRLALGLVPETQKIEAKEQQLRQEYRRLQDIEKSEELEEFNKLQSYVESKDFKERRKKIELQSFKNSDLFKKEKELKKLQGSSDIKIYNRFKDSSEFEVFQKIDQSEKLKEYLQLKEYIESEDFKSIVKYYKLPGSKKFAKSDLAQVVTDFNKLKKDPLVKGYQKFTAKKEFEDYKKHRDSDIPERFTELKNKIHSTSLKSRVKELKKNNEFDESPEKAEMSEYHNLKLDYSLKNFFKLKGTKLEKVYLEALNSSKLEAYNQLKSTIESSGFKSQKEQIENERFEDSDAYTKKKRFDELNNDDEIRQYFKVKKSKELKVYQQLENSDRLNQYNDLEKEVNSDEFQKQKAYLLQSGQEKFKQSELYPDFERYETLNNYENLQFYFANKDSKKYNEVKQWGLTFEETFEEEKLDTSKWMTRYFWGDALLGASYSMLTDKHFFTDKNFEFNKDRFSIVTRKEEVEGKAWDPKLGFIDKTFPYSSGLISTAQSFRQKYGRFEAKLRFNSNYPVNHTFWLLSEKMLPHIDVAKTNKGIHFNYFWKNGTDEIHNKSSKAGSRYRNDYYIFTLEWTENEMIWKINGVTALKQKSDVPQDPMYMVLSSGVFDNEPTNQELPASFDIGWVRCYQKVK
jgi:hypothetical protein